MKEMEQMRLLAPTNLALRPLNPPQGRRHVVGPPDPLDMHTPLGFQSKILRGFLGPFLKNRVKKLLLGLDQKLINPS